jgi:acyl-CoA thioester hydrolase
MNERAIEGTVVCEGTVKPEWIDFNGHMNVAWYVHAFDLGIDALWEQFGITESYVNAGRGSTFAVENHVTWQRELHEGERYVVTSQILAYDEKRIHQFQRMYRARELALAATAEWMNLHVDLGTRRVSPWPGDVLDAIRAFVESQAGQDRPPEAGRRISVAKPIYTLQEEQA